MARGKVTALCAATVLAVASVSVSVTAAAAADPAGGGRERVLPEPARGESAIAALGASLNAVAAQNRKSPAALKELLRSDDTVWVDPSGQLLVKDTELPDAAAAPAPEAGPYPNDQTFGLHSKPGAPRTIFLDFDGHTVSGTAWNDYYGVASGPHPAFDTNGSPATWSQAELDLVQSVWQRVAEDFAPFNVDVTTQDPGEAKLTRSSGTDNSYGTRVLISPSSQALNSICGGGCGGVAFVGIFNLTGSGYYQPAWVFPQALSNNAKYIAEAASHEAGHNLGLSHDGTSTTGYYTGHGHWAPIMGVGYYEPLVQWSKGEYADANNIEDDYAVMKSYGLNPRPDDHGSTVGSPRALGAARTASGYLERRSDKDVFSFTHCSGALTATVTTAPNSPNVDSKLRLLTSAGAVLATANPASGESNFDVATGLGASVTKTLSAGTYYLEVDGTSFGSPLTTGYSDYGSIGQYSLTISPSC